MYMTTVDLITILFLCVGLALTLHSRFRKWVCTTTYGEMLWGALTLKQRNRLFQFIIGPGITVLAAAFLYDAIVL